MKDKAPRKGIWRRNPLNIEIYGNHEDSRILEVNADRHGFTAQRYNDTMNGSATISNHFYEGAGNADAFVFTKTSPLFYIMGVLDETGTKNPLFCHYNKDKKQLKEEHQAHIQQLIDSGAPDAEIEKEKKRNWEAELRLPKPFAFLGERKSWDDFLHIMSSLEANGMLRMDPKKLFFSKEFTAIFHSFSEQLELPRRRHVRFSVHDRREDIASEEGVEAHEPRITVAYFGSASTKDPDFIKAGHEMAALATQSKWNMVHGGGSDSVMQALTDGVKDYNAQNGTDSHVTGISVFAKYVAPVFAAKGGEQDAQAKQKHKADLFIECKDMGTRMYEFGARSHAFVVMPGGIGTVHEILQVAHDRIKKLPHTQYLDKAGEQVDMPLIVVNLKGAGKKGVWDDLLYYLNAHEPNIAKQITVVSTVKEAHQKLEQFFAAHEPCLTHLHKYPTSLQSAEVAGAAMANHVDALASRQGGAPTTGQLR